MEDGEGGVHKRSLAAQIETKLNQFQYLVLLLNIKLNLKTTNKSRIPFTTRSRSLFFEIVTCFIHIGSFRDNNSACTKFVRTGCVSDE